MTQQPQEQRYQSSSPRAHLHVVGMLRFMFDINQPSLPTPFYSVLVLISVYMALSTVFHSIKSPDNSPLSHSVLPVLFLPYWSFQLYSHTCYAYCQGFLSCLFLHFRSIHLHFFQNLSRFFPVLAVANTWFLCRPAE